MFFKDTNSVAETKSRPLNINGRLTIAEGNSTGVIRRCFYPATGILIRPEEASDACPQA